MPLAVFGLFTGQEPCLDGEACFIAVFDFTDFELKFEPQNDACCSPEEFCELYANPNLKEHFKSKVEVCSNLPSSFNGLNCGNSYSCDSDACPAGFIGTKPDCVTCPAGFICPVAGIRDDPTECPVGFYCPEGSIAPISCPDGTIGDALGLESIDGCIPVDAPCEAGTFGDNCDTCPSGNYCPGADSDPIPCPAGRYFDQIGAQSLAWCFFCPAGTYCPTEGSISPIECPKNTFTDSVGAIECTSCPPGFITYFTGTADALDCAPAPACDKQNELWTECGSPCEAKCFDLAPKCIDVCVPRCECETGFVRDSNENCILAADCDNTLPLGLWSDFGDWSECSEECDSGIRTRSRDCQPDGFLCQGPDTEVQVCNTQRCNIIDTDVCSCPATGSADNLMSEEWVCQSDCDADHICQRTDLLVNRCQPRDIGVCTSWGDPHIITFDGATNDVYGIARYVFARTIERNEAWFHASIATEAWGTVSITRTLTVEFSPDSSSYGEGIDLRIKTDRFGLFEVWRRQDSADWDLVATNANVDGGILSKINLLPGRIQYKTWFGLEVDHSGLDATIKIPAYYNGKVEGLCGNFDFDRTNDYQLRDGTVLPYEENLPPYVRKRSSHSQWPGLGRSPSWTLR